MKSFELNWIRKVDKSIPIPEVIFFPLSDATGMYFSPDCDNVMFDADGYSYSMDYGVIVVSTLAKNEDIEGTIAHEWRHHWQQYNGFEYDESTITEYDEEKMNYDEFAFQYFTTSKAELDALRFEYKYSNIPDQWEELLFKELKDLHVKPVITYKNNPLKKDYSKYTKNFK